MAAQQPNQSDTSSGVLWTVAALFLVIGVIWWKFRSYIVTYYFKVKLLEIQMLSYFTHNNLDNARDYMLGVDPKVVPFQDMVKVGELVGYYLRIPCIILIVLLAIIVFFSNSVRIFKRNYSMRDLATLEQTNYPQISSVTKLDLVKENIDKGPWAMAMTPMQFCKRYGLLEEYKRQAQEGMSLRERNKIEVKLQRGKANKVFATQLGPLWAGTDRLPPHVKALFAIFAARFNADPAAFTMLKQLSRSATSKLDFSGVDELCKKHESTKQIQKIMASHGYMLTVMASMLEAAREDGVQASADFLWLKPVDRRLWYLLNTVGRQTPFSEVAGIFAHWVAEKEMQRKLLIPMVEEATNALELALTEVLYKSEEG